MGNTNMVTVPSGIELPAHLQTTSIAAEIAAINAAAAGGIKAGGFPSISKKAGKFHIKDGGELSTLFMPALPGQQPLPMMCLEVVILDANPALSKTYYPGEYVEGSSEEPTCRSSNGATPDADVVEKQFAACAICPKNQWGSKVSKLSGKDIKACGEFKQLAVLPANDLSFKALGLQITGGSLGNWGKYVQALSQRGYPVFGLVTNVTFDATQTGVLQFALNRFLSVDEVAKVRERQQGDDVKTIVSQSRTIVAAPALPAPVAQPALPAPTVGYAPSAPPPNYPPPVATIVPTAAPAPTVGFGAAPAGFVSAATATPATEPPKRTRRTRAQMAADAAPAPTPTPTIPVEGAVDLSYLPPGIKAAVEALGADSVPGRALLAQFPAPGGVVPSPTPALAPAPATAPPPTPAPTPTVGFGAAASPSIVAAGASLAEILKKKLAEQGGRVVGA